LLDFSNDVAGIARAYNFVRKSEKTGWRITEMAKTADYSLGPATYPRGWFVIAESSELGSKPLALKFHGKDLVLYRGESGRIVLLDAYCPHMGTHLGASDTAHLASAGKQIEGDSIRCPYHGWRFNANGECDDIPYYDGKCPKTAAINSYRVVESMGCVMAWFDQEGGGPDYKAPFLEEWDDPMWIRWELDHCGDLSVHSQELMDNMADVRHLGPTHGSPCEYFENEIKGIKCIQHQGGFHKDYDCMIDTITWYDGPAILFSKQVIGETNTYEFIAHTPIEDGIIRIWHAVLYKASSDKPTREETELAKKAQAGALASLLADFGVWRNKSPATRIIQLPTDGPFNICRKWYSQFYMPVDDAKNLQREIDGIYPVKDFPSKYDEVEDRAISARSIT